MYPLTSKKAEEVANALLPIFLTLGAPVISQSDNGREIVNCVIIELSTLWTDLKLVTGRTRHPQSQGAVERLDGVVPEKLTKSTKLNVGLIFVRWQINFSKHKTIKNNPFKVTFREEPKVGLNSTVVPSSLLNTIHTEEDLEKLLPQVSENELHRYFW